MDIDYIKDVIHAITGNYTSDCNELLVGFKSDQTYIEDAYKDEFQFFKLGARLKDPTYVEYLGRSYWQTADKLFAWDEHNEMYLFWHSADTQYAEDNEGQRLFLLEWDVNS